MPIAKFDILMMYISVCIQSLQQVSTLFGFGSQVFSVKWIFTDHYGNPFNDFNTSCIHCGDLSRSGTHVLAPFLTLPTEEVHWPRGKTACLC